MVQYQQVRKDDGTVNPNLILRVDDTAWIPNAATNFDWQSYLAWKAAGNTPLPPAALSKPASEVELDAQIALALDAAQPLDQRFEALLKILDVRTPSA